MPCPPAPPRPAATSGALALRLHLLSVLGLGACAGGKIDPAGQGSEVGGGVGGAGDGADGGAGDGADGGAGDGGGGGLPPCADPAPVPAADGGPTGFVRCADGSVNRAEALPTTPVIEAPRCTGTEDRFECREDADCSAGPHGACLVEVGLDAPDTTCACTYACASDADCGPAQLCLPAGVVDGGPAWASCVDATCAGPADCPSAECGVASYHNGCWEVILAACRDPAADACRVDADCPEPGQQCAADAGDPRFACREADCDIGRPLWVAGELRLAPRAAGGAWCAAAGDDPGDDPSDDPADTPPPALAAAAARAWADRGLAEHASVASFARFTLELLALGAPPELLADAQAAGLDEVRHAEAAFALARAFGGQDVGPGPLDLRGIRPAERVEDVLVALVEEACVAETLGVVEAQEAAAAARGPARAALLRVADDEARHAALAWRTLAWILGRRPGLRPLARAAVERGLRRALEPDLDGGGPSADLSAWGLPPVGARRAARARAAALVVRPLAAALLGPPPGAPARAGDPALAQMGHAASGAVQL